MRRRGGAEQGGRRGTHADRTEEKQRLQTDRQEHICCVTCAAGAAAFAVRRAMSPPPSATGKQNSREAAHEQVVQARLRSSFVAHLHFLPFLSFLTLVVQHG